MKTILVTGGSKERKSVVKQALEKKYKVIFTYNKNKRSAEKFSKIIKNIACYQSRLNKRKSKEEIV